MHGTSKEELKNYASKYYNIDFDLEDLHKNYKHNERYQESVPQTLYCFLSSSSFSDCLKRVRYIGRDADTKGYIACAIASAYYKEIPNELLKQVQANIPADFNDLIVEHKSRKNQK